MSEIFDRLNEEFLSYSPPFVLWHQITALSIYEPFNRNHLYLLFSQATNLRILSLRYRFELETRFFLKEETLIDLLSDDSLCNMLMTNGLRQLNVFTFYEQLNCLDIVHSIVKRLPHLEVLQLHDDYCRFLEVEVAQMLINGLSKLSFLTLDGCPQKR